MSLIAFILAVLSAMPVPCASGGTGCYQFDYEPVHRFVGGTAFA